jgi:hypothetical protein
MNEDDWDGWDISEEEEGWVEGKNRYWDGREGIDWEWKRRNIEE